MNLFKRRPCAGCLAKEQTIALLADLVDWHRGQMGLHAQSASATAAPPLGEVPPPAQWAGDDEEVIAAALDYGAIDAASAERLMAHMQAQNTQLTVVK